MNIDIIISADHIKENQMKDKIVVVIDMLRATSVITTALANGCKKVIPVLTVEEAFEIASKNKENTILGGERQALKIDGFDFSNSPLEYKKELVEGKDVVITTTNGTRAINGCKGAYKIFVGAMINARAIALKLAEEDKDVVFLNAGTNGQFSMDDFICAGYMISCLMENKEYQLTDIAKTAKYIYESNNNIIDYIKSARHFSVITNLGLQDDLSYCMKKDLYSIVPEYKDREIKICDL